MSRASFLLYPLPRCSHPRLRPHPIHPHRLLDILDGLFSQILERQSQLVLDVVVDGFRDADASALGQSLDSGRNIDSIAVDPFPFHNHIPQVDADTKLHSAIFRQGSVPACEFLLDLNCALHRVHDTPELSQ